MWLGIWHPQTHSTIWKGGEEHTSQLCLLQMEGQTDQWWNCLSLGRCFWCVPWGYNFKYHNDSFTRYCLLVSANELLFCSPVVMLQDFQSWAYCKIVWFRLPDCQEDKHRKVTREQVSCCSRVSCFIRLVLCMYWFLEGNDACPRLIFIIFYKQWCTVSSHWLVNRAEKNRWLRLEIN